VAGTLLGKTGERLSPTARIGCTPWQLVHVATRPSPAINRFPWTLVRNRATSSVGIPGLKRRMTSGLLWQAPQSPGNCGAFGFPTKPFLGSMASMPGARASPPWQAVHVKPRRTWTSSAIRSAGAARRPPRAR